MDIKYFLILPTQLYEKKYLPKYIKSNVVVILWECPWYFNNPKYKFNKKKLILHKGSLEYYYHYIKNLGIRVVKVKYNENIKTAITGNYGMFDSVDNIKLLNLPSRPSIIEESPNFLLTKRDYSDYRDKTDKFFFNSFYTFGKKIINVIPLVKSQDKQNRKTLSNTRLAKLNIPNTPTLRLEDKKYIKIGVKYIKNNFNDNYGNVKNFIFPLTHKTAKRWLTYFINYKFKIFGDYQDFINKDNEFMYHSMLSTSMNIGLINPCDIINIIKKVKKKIPINSYEGFIRQLFWREYQRYTYIYFYSITSNRKLNYFSNNKRLTSAWYNGKLNIPPVDDAIKKGFDIGYLHHINRLMVIGNYMNLTGINPQQGFKWFMEFSCDSYDWVMCQNVYGMVFFADGGKTMRRPYMSSSNYILKMSNYTKDIWSDKWNSLYKSFIKKNKANLHKYRYYYR
jgi:deoxyribodipyrimidine photolyase-related protein